MKERFTSERFQLKLAGKMDILTPKEPLILEILPVNISARGTLLNASESLSEGTRLWSRLAGPSGRTKQLTAVQSLIRVEREAKRSTPTRMGVWFGEKYQILCLKSL